MFYGILYVPLAALSMEGEFERHKAPVKMNMYFMAFRWLERLKLSRLVQKEQIKARGEKSRKYCGVQGLQQSLCWRDRTDKKEMDR